MKSRIQQEIAAKNHIALERLYDRYGRVVYRFAYNTVHDPALAEQVLLKLFSLIWNSGGELFQSGERISTQMLRMTQNLAIEILQEGKQSKTAAIEKRLCPKT